MKLSKVSWSDIADDLEMEDVVDGLGIRILQVKGFEHIAQCPMPSHPGADKNPSFSINVDKKLANCFVCGGFSIPQVVMQLLGLDEENDAIAWLLQYSDFDNEDDGAFINKIAEALTKQEESGDQHELTLPYFNMRIVEKWVDTPTDFYHKRRISDEVREALKLGYDPSHTLSGYTGAAAIIPHIFRNKLVGYQRRWDTDPSEWPRHIHKYMNTDDFPKRYTLYGYDYALQRKNEPVFVVESALTVARLMSAGHAAVSTFGASVNQHQVKLLASFPHLVVAPDNDEAGEKAMFRLYRQIDELSNVDYVPPPPHAKWDLGDADDEMLDDLMSKICPAFVHFADME